MTVRRFVGAGLIALPLVVALTYAAIVSRDLRIAIGVVFVCMACFGFGSILWDGPKMRWRWWTRPEVAGEPESNHRPIESWLETTTRNVRERRRMRKIANDTVKSMDLLNKIAIEANNRVSEDHNDAVDVAILTHLSLIATQLSFLVTAAHRQYDQSLISMHEDSVPRIPEEE